MTDLEIAVLVFLGWVNGVFLGYIIWAPLTTFKQGFVDGLSLKFLWRKK
jgi:hypothetical protein